MSRTDSGSEIPAIDNFAAAYVTPAIYFNWYPDRLNTTNQRASRRYVAFGLARRGQHDPGVLARSE